MTLRSIRSIGPLLMLAALTIPLSTTAQAEIQTGWRRVRDH